ncbi:MAG: AbrB/MazE/SpoVT family DNA-binding domain-containing protein [Candidatus Omnitrophota bacterium]|nr:AbrB/MazE/SpoVT family DNA-binding domain-containing protein [Candidatus Omnitrophota bacterium]
MRGAQKQKIFGTVTVGERGQIVIPAELRKKFKVKPGDRLVAFAKHRMFGFIQVEEFNRFVSELSRAALKFKRRRAKGR